MNLKSIFGGGAKEEGGATDPLRPVLDEATAAIEERQRILDAIERVNAKLSEAGQALKAALERIQAEEFEAAQVENGLAVASKAAVEDRAEAELLAKSAKLRLQKLNADLDAANARVIALAEAAQQVIHDRLQVAIADVHAELGALIEPFAKGVFKVMALAQHCGNRNGEEFDFHAPYLGQLRVFNPVERYRHDVSARPHGSLRAGVFQLPGGRTGSFNQNWDTDPDAKALDEAATDMKRRAEPLQELARTIRGR